ncbi:ATP-binding protein [Candidatus Micrarchaeota archaeon]|nr:ATP-binding protein [Candidatus Micrarchaeota archaeon]
MNTFIQFINRENELAFLERQAAKGAAFIVIYGRRRVGKSELLKHFIRNRKAIYLLATQEVEKELVADFSKDIAAHFGDNTLDLNPFESFAQLTEYLEGKNLSGTILIIDEFPYLVDSNKAIPSIIQKSWDEHLKAKGLTLILCGSSIGAMETEVLGRKSPLYGRRTGQWKVDPLPFKEFTKFYPGLAFEKLVEFYSMAGGIPLYILELDPKKSVRENAKLVMASRGSILYQEVDIILKEELREPKTYFSILREINAGRNTLNEISNAIGIERTAIVRYIDTLIELDLIEGQKPVTAEEKSRKTSYALKDNYFKFWFQFVYPFKKELDSFKFEQFGKNLLQNFNSYVGRQFEQVCSEALRIVNPIGAAEVGRWWGAYREEGERKTAEIDIVSLNAESKTILFGECKWRDNVDADAVLKGLKAKAALMPWNLGKRREIYAIFAKSFRKKLASEDIILYNLKELERIFLK